MFENKLIVQLSHLDAHEMQRFRDFVFSPFHNKNKKLQQLFIFIEKHYPDFKTETFTKKAAYKAMYAGNKYDDSKLRAMTSMLSRLLEDFLTIDRFRNDETQYDLMLLDALQDKGMDKYYGRQLEKMYARQEQSPHRDIAHHFNGHQIEQRSYNFAVSRKAPHIAQSLYRVIHDLDAYYIASRLKFSCELLNRQNILGEPFDMKSLQIMLDFLKENKALEIPVLTIYFFILQTFLEPENEDHFDKLLNLLESHARTFPPAENKVMFGYAMNYCIKKINSGKNGYLEKVFLLYELLIEHGAIFEGAFLSQWDYKNIVTTALRLNKTEWTENFIHGFKDRLHLAVRNNAFKYNLANLNYFKGDFDKTMLLLREVEFTDISYELSAKSLLLKSYFELNEYEALFNHAETFKLFLRRNKKISAYQKNIYKNLLRYIVKLSELKSMQQRVPDSLINEIENASDIADKTWLLKKTK